MGVYNSDTTLGDLNRLDRDNYNHIDNKEAQTYRFPSHSAALKFVNQCIKKSLERCGVKMLPGNGEEMEKVMDAKNIRVEHRDYPPEEELYMSGWFIYDNREISAFISNPFIYKTDFAANQDFFVRTTVKGVF